MKPLLNFKRKELARRSEKRKNIIRKKKKRERYFKKLHRKLLRETMLEMRSKNTMRSALLELYYAPPSFFLSFIPGGVGYWPTKKGFFSKHYG